jgi:hypothetical protein
MLYIARDPGSRLRDIREGVGITERRAHGLVLELTRATGPGLPVCPDKPAGEAQELPAVVFNGQWL